MDHVLLNYGLKWFHRLNKVRNLLVDQSFADENMAKARGGEHLTDRRFWENKMTSDQPELIPLLDRWAQLVRNNSADPETGESFYMNANWRMRSWVRYDVLEPCWSGLWFLPIGSALIENQREMVSFRLNMLRTVSDVRCRYFGLLLDIWRILYGLYVKCIVKYWKLLWPKRSGGLSFLPVFYCLFMSVLHSLCPSSPFHLYPYFIL